MNLLDTAMVYKCVKHTDDSSSLIFNKLYTYLKYLLKSYKLK